MDYRSIDENCLILYGTKIKVPFQFPLVSNSSKYVVMTKLKLVNVV